MKVKEISKFSPSSWYKDNYQESITNPDKFWKKQSKQLNWAKAPTIIKNTSFKNDVQIKWFEDGQLNVCYNCVDRHVENGKGENIAIIWEGDNPSDSKKVTYNELLKEVSIMANILEKNGVKKGDNVIIYMPMILETAYAMLAIARIGAVHGVVFGGFSSKALADRIENCNPKLVITADESKRGGKNIPLKANVDEAFKINSKSIKCLVVQNTGGEVGFNENDIWYHKEKKLVSQIHSNLSVVNAEDPLFILYTSGSTGAPKGLVHTSAGYLLYSAFTFKTTFNYNNKNTVSSKSQDTEREKQNLDNQSFSKKFDYSLNSSSESVSKHTCAAQNLKSEQSSKKKADYQGSEVYWCTADVGWITGHSYVVYGPLANGATTLMFEGVPSYPDASRFWQIIDKHKVNIFYTAPTAIRALMKEGDQYLNSTSRKSLRILGTVGEPINPEAWDWYNEKIGKNNCEIVDTWWQTETGGHMITPIPNQIKTKPACATLPFFGVQPTILSSDAKELIGQCEGNLAIKDSWPGQARTIFGDHKRFIQTYFTQFKGYYFTGDGAKRDEDGYYRITGRVDDVLNVSGHRIGTAEVEAALNKHAKTCESAVVGFPHDIKGEGIYAYVILNKNENPSEELKTELKKLVRSEIGAIATPEIIHFVPDLPKTRSGKIMRRIIRKIAAGESDNLGDLSTLTNPDIIEAIISSK